MHNAIAILDFRDYTGTLMISRGFERLLPHVDTSAIVRQSSIIRDIHKRLALGLPALHSAFKAQLCLSSHIHKPTHVLQAKMHRCVEISFLYEHIKTFQNNLLKIEPIGLRFWEVHTVCHSWQLLLLLLFCVPMTML